MPVQRWHLLGEQVLEDGLVLHEEREPALIETGQAIKGNRGVALLQDREEKPERLLLVAAGHE